MKVRTDILRHAKELHTWVGISSGILLFICFFAGGLSMFQHELSQWSTPAQQQLAPIETTEYNQLVSKVQAEYPETLKSFQLNFDSDEFYYAPMQWQAKRDAEGHDDHGIDLHQNSMLATLNVNHQIQVEQQNLFKLGWLIEQLHETAGIPGSIGHHMLGVYIMGIVCVLYFLALLTGLVVLLPTLVKDYFAIRKGKNKKRFWLDAHNVIGITSLPFHILICISVIGFAFHDVIYDAIEEMVSKDQPISVRPAAVKVVEPVAALNIENILHNIQQQAPEYKISSISFNHLDQPAKASARANLYSPDQMLRGDRFDVMVFNPYQTEPYRTNNLNTHATPMDQLIRSMFSLHFGNYGGDYTRWLYLIFGLGGAFLFYSGNILWIESRVKRQRNLHQPPIQQPQSVRFVASLTIGSCLGCILAIVFCMGLARWSSLVGMKIESVNHVLVYTYYLIFLSSIAYSFRRGAAKALPHLLLSIALFLILLLPVSLVISFGTAVNMLMWQVEVIALGIGLLFFRFYQQAKYRQTNVSQGSMWC